MKLDFGGIASRLHAAVKQGGCDLIRTWRRWCHACGRALWRARRHRPFRIETISDINLSKPLKQDIYAKT